MRPLNGKCRMTNAEKNARRRELDANPFHHALTLKRQKAYRDRTKEHRNETRRANYIKNAERERARQKRWSEANKDKKAAYWKKWAEKNRDKLHARDRMRYDTPEGQAKVVRDREKRRQRIANDPAYAEHIRSMRRAAYQRNKDRTSGIRWLLKSIWIPKWKKIIISSPAREEAYLKRCSERTRIYYTLWKRCDPLIEKLLNTQKGK